MAAPKEAIAIILDLGPSMSHGGEHGRGCFETALKAINMIIQRKIFSKSKDEVAFILFGTEESNNPLHEGGGYDNITIARELSPPDLDLLSLINKSVTPGDIEADFVDAMIVAMDHLISKTSGRKFGLRIVLFSDLSSPFGTDQLDVILNSMKEKNIQLTFVGPDLDVGESDDLEEENRTEQNQNEKEEDIKKQDKQHGGLTRDGKPLTPQQIQGVNCINHILEEIDGEGVSLSEVLPMLSFFQLRSVKQTTVFRGPLQIGNSLNINVYGYCKLKEAKPGSWKKLSALSAASANPQSMAVSYQRSYHLQDEDQTEIEKEDVTKAYKYGKSLIPISKVDQDSMKLETEKCLSILGFTDRANIQRNLFMGDSVYIFVPQPDDEHAAVALSAVVHALEEKRMVAVARYCFRKNAAPKLGILVPQIKGEYEGLIFVQVPFREDVRQYQFPSLATSSKGNPSEEQLQVMDSLIDNMDLSSSHITDDGDRLESFKARRTMNPLIQRQCQCIQQRALNPEEEKLPDVDDHILRLLNPIPEMTNRCNQIFEKLKETFPTEVVEEKKPSAASNIFAKANEDQENDSTLGLSQSATTPADFSFASIDHTGITEVGTVDPVRDYQILLSRGGSHVFNDVTKELQTRILQLVNDSFLNQNYAKALECLKAFRQESVKMKNSISFNDFLNELKTKMMGSRRSDFWHEVSKEKVAPIINTESSDSALSEQDVMSFFETSMQSNDEKAPDAEMEDVDDLLDMM